MREFQGSISVVHMFCQKSFDAIDEATPLAVCKCQVENKVRPANRVRPTRASLR